MTKCCRHLCNEIVRTDVVYAFYAFHVCFSSGGYLVADVNVIWVFHRLWALLESNGLVLSRHRHDLQLFLIMSEDCKTEKVCVCVLDTEFLYIH